MTKNTVLAANTVNDKWARLNGWLCHVRRLQEEGDKDGATEAVSQLLQNNAESVLKLAIDRSCNRLERTHKVSRDLREDVMQTVCYWLMDGTMLQAQTDNLVGWIQNRITYDGYRAGCKDIADIYGIHNLRIPVYDAEQGYIDKDIHARDASCSDLTDSDRERQLACCGNVSEIFRDPEEIWIGNLGMSETIRLADTITAVVLPRAGVCVKQFEAYCVAYHADHGVTLARYRGADKALANINKSWRRGALMPAILAALRSADVSNTYVDAIAACTDWCGKNGMRNIVAGAVAVAAKNA